MERQEVSCNGRKAMIDPDQRVELTDLGRKVLEDEKKRKSHELLEEYIHISTQVGKPFQLREDQITPA